MKKFGWKRPMENVPHILRGVARGNIHPDNYPHLFFEVPNSQSNYSNKDEIQRHAYYLLKKGTFIGWCLLNNGFPLCRKIYIWFRGDSRMDWIETYEDLIKAMKSHQLIKFEQPHFEEVATLYQYYEQRNPEFRFEDED